MKLSACMIVKNEHGMLPRCLKSIRNLCDEIIVVDTGSTDDTVQIAELFNCRVYHHPWENDFSLHRNQSIGYATGDWIAIVDADEELVSNINPANFKNKLKRLPEKVNALVCTIQENREEVTGKWFGNRFFKKSSGIRYENYIHNQPKFEGFSGMTDIVINHYGYSLSPEKMNAKYERTRQLLQKRLSENPEDYEALKYMVDVHMAKKEYAEAVACGTRCLELLPVGPDKMQTYSILYFYMAKACLCLWSAQGDKVYADRAVQWAKHGVSLFPEDIDLNFIMAQIGYRAGDAELYSKHAARYWEGIERYDNPRKLTEFETEIDDKDSVNRNIFSITTTHRDAVRMMRGELLKGAA